MSESGRSVLLDTSADSELDRSQEKRKWLAESPGLLFSVSVFTVVERLRGYNLALRSIDASRAARYDRRRTEYLASLVSGIFRVLPFTTQAALFAAEIMALAPQPPSPPQRSHRRRETHTDRLSRWRFDTMIAATALAQNLTLAHNNSRDFDAIRAAMETAPERFRGSLELIHIDELTS